MNPRISLLESFSTLKTCRDFKGASKIRRFKYSLLRIADTLFSKTIFSHSRSKRSSNRSIVENLRPSGRTIFFSKEATFFKAAKTAPNNFFRPWQSALPKKLPGVHDPRQTRHGADGRLEIQTSFNSSISRLVVP